MAALQILAIAAAIAVVCALPCAKTHRFYLRRQASNTALALMYQALVAMK
jgi:TM2 domain-containing membrane protein YozV